MTTMWRLMHRGLSQLLPKIATTNSITNVAQRNIHCLCSNQTLKTPLQLGASAAAFLQPTTPLLAQNCGFKVKGVLKRRCKDCYFVMRRARLYIICKTHPRHKQMSIVPREKDTWTMTHATQSPKRPW